MSSGNVEKTEFVNDTLVLSVFFKLFDAKYKIFFVSGPSDLKRILAD